MQTIEYEVKEGVAYIRLNRPEKLNAFNKEMALLLQQRLDEAGKDHRIRAVYLTGNGKAFSAGQDLSELTAQDAPGFDSLLRDHYNPIVTKIRNLEKPVVCAVNGTAAGAGANIALCCDVVVAAHSASFIQAFSKIGLIPDSGGSYFLPRLIGWQKASALAMLGDRISATEADGLGMIYKVFDNDSFVTASIEIVLRLAKMPTRGLALTKQALNLSMTNGLASQLEVEDDLQQKATATADYREGVSAFLEKRQPDFRGE
jgi:2-(1,2-epoxy-1,2-dihydrophenyl)acetyl-CoA isomerase